MMMFLLKRKKNQLRMMRSRWRKRSKRSKGKVEKRNEY